MVDRAWASFFSSLVVVDQVDVRGLLIKAKDHPAVAGDLHRPETLQIALEWMQPVARTTEILGRIGRIEIVACHVALVNAIKQSLNMCACFAYQSRDLAGWEDSLAKLLSGSNHGCCDLTNGRSM